MAQEDVRLSGAFLDSAGNALASKTATLFAEGTITPALATDTTDSSGEWDFTVTTPGRYDVQLVTGTQTYRILSRDKFQVTELQSRNPTTAQPALSAYSTTSEASSLVATFGFRPATESSGVETADTPSDNDNGYIDYTLSNDHSSKQEWIAGRFSWVGLDVSDGSEDGQIKFEAMAAGSLATVLTMDSTGVTGSIIKDEDNMASDSATHLASQQSIKAYVDSQQDTVDTWGEVLALGNASSGTGVVITAGDAFTVNTITETTGGSGVTIDSVLLKDNTVKAGTLTIGAGSITDSSNAIDFGNEALTTTGVITAGGLTVGSAVLIEAELEMLDGITAGTAAASKAVVLDGSKNIATIGTIGSGAITATGTSSFATAIRTPLIEFTDGDDAITIADGGGITAAAGITSTAAANTLGATSFNDASITNVNDIALDSISADGTDINVAVSDNSATALTVKQGSDAYLIIDTANSSESVSIGTGISGTEITLGHGTSEVTVADNLTVTGDLTVSGTTTTVDTTNTVVTDNLLELNSGATSNANDSGIIIERGSTGNNAILMWDESADVFTVGTTTATADSTGNLANFAAAPFTAAAIVGTTIDAATDFTIGATVITDGVITDASGLSIAAAVDLGSNTLTSTGSLQVRTIDYSDGDLAMTIADGGGVTFAQAVDLGSNTLTTTGSLQVRTIDYSDGDNAITIADGGGTTFAAAVDLGSNTLTSTGSLQVRTIDYSDGDLAMTIADGGGVTFAQSATLANDATITLQDEGQVIFADDTPSADHSGTGIVVKMTALTGLGVMECVHIDSNGKLNEADADAVTTMPAIGIALEANSSGSDADVKILTQGVVVDASWSFTPGADLFVGTTDDAGAVTATAPSGSGDTVQKIGVALTSTSAFLNFNTTEVLLA